MSESHTSSSWRSKIAKALFERRPIVPVVRLAGPIGMVTPLRPGLSLSGVAHALARAFRIRRAPAVAIVINSPGGSPVQSHLIHTRIRQLAEQHGKPVYAFIEDVGASGGYLVALAGDEIIVDTSSIVGSIGVVSAGFGLHRLIDKIGVDRRVYTSGERKVMLDPFQPEKEEDVERLKALQSDVQGMFVDLVKERRGGALKGSDETLFSGEFWSGRKALDLGLVDRIGDLMSVMRERYGEKVRLYPVPTARAGLLRRLAAGNAQTSGGNVSGWADELVTAVETRALWSRYGL
jgi:signal peptide peptidase SppA